MSAIHWSIVLAKIDLVSLYFRLLWYHSILKGSIDQYSKIHSPLACSRWLPWFPDLSRPYVACVKRGIGETYVRSQSLSSDSAVKSINTSVSRQEKKDSNIPSPGRTRLVKCTTPGLTKTIKSPPQALPPPRRLYIDRCIRCCPAACQWTVLWWLGITITHNLTQERQQGYWSLQILPASRGRSTLATSWGILEDSKKVLNEDDIKTAFW